VLAIWLASALLLVASHRWIRDGKVGKASNGAAAVLLAAGLTRETERQDRLGQATDNTLRSSSDMSLCVKRRIFEQTINGISSEGLIWCNARTDGVDRMACSTAEGRSQRLVSAW